MNDAKDPRAQRRPPPLRSEKPRSAGEPAAGSKPSPLPLVLLGAALGTVAAVVLLGGLAAGIWLWRSAGRNRSADLASAGTPLAHPVKPPPVEKPKVVQPTPQPVYDPTQFLPEDIRKQAREKQPKEDKKEEPAPADFVAAPPTETGPKSSPRPQRPPVFEDIRKLQNRLELPPVTPPKISAFERTKFNTTPKKLAKLYVDDVKQCKLQIEGQEFSSNDVVQYRVEFGHENNVPTWNLMSEAKEGLKKGVSTWAAFQLKGDDLWFGWKTPPPLRLQLCKLAISVGGETQRCRLTAVEKVKAIQVDKNSAKPIALTSLEATYREGDQVQVELRFHGIEGAAFRGKRTLKIGDSDTVKMTNPHVTEEMGEPAVEIDVSLVQGSPGQKPQLLAEVMAYPERLEKRGMPGEVVARPVKQPLTAEMLSECRNTLDAFAKAAAEKTLAKLEREKRSKWIRLPAESRHGAIAYGELNKLMRQLTHDETKQGEVIRLKNMMDDEDQFPKEVKDAFNEFGLEVEGRLEQVRQYEQAVGFVSTRQAWCDAMEKFQTELYNSGRIEYRVYLETADGPIDLEMTEGFGAN